MAVLPGCRLWCREPKRAAKSKRPLACLRGRQAQGERFLVEINARDLQRFAFVPESLKTQRSIKLARAHLHCGYMERDTPEPGLRARCFDQRRHHPAAP